MARMRPVIITIKHYVNNENTSLASGAIRSIDLIDAVGQSAVSNVQDVVEGSKVSAIFIEHWVKSFANAGTDVKFQALLEKVPAGATSVTFSQMNSLMGYLNKKNVLWFSQGVLGDGTTQSVPITRDWHKIPKSKQRFGLGDKLVLTISATDFALQNCGFATFKEQK